MKPINDAIAMLSNHFQRGDTLPRLQLRRLGLIYSSYRFIISSFFMVMVYVTAKSDSNLLLPSLLQQTALTFYVLISLILLGLTYVVTQKLRPLLAYGMALDVIILSLLLYTNGAPDIQLTMLYMVVVAASFMLLHSSQALVITLLAIIFVIYQQFFYAIANSMSLTNLGEALLMSVSFLAVGFLSWSISQRLVQVEKVAALNAKEVKRLNVINKEVITQMVNGVIVIDKQQIVLANLAAYQLLNISNDSLLYSTIHSGHSSDKVSNPESSFSNIRRDSQKYKLSNTGLNESYSNDQNHDKSILSDFQRQLSQEHPILFHSCMTAEIEQSNAFIYELPVTLSVSTIGKLRVQTIPLKDSSQLIILEDLSREQASAQQLKLASLGQLTASIAHEIRNPLAAISQASQLLMEDVIENRLDATVALDSASSNQISASSQDITNDKNTPSDKLDLSGNHELYQMIFAQTKRVNRIIEDVLKLSRQQTPNLIAIELSQWMQQFLVDHFHGHDVFLNIDVQPIIQFDISQLEQILINLINNGLRYSSYTHPHAYVEIDIYCVNNDVIIDILDAGVGVKTDNINHLFDPFFTTDAAGTGLGLYLSQAFCEANHARLLYIPEHEKTCFRIIAPALNSSIFNENSI